MRILEYNISWEAMSGKQTEGVTTACELIKEYVHIIFENLLMIMVHMILLDY